MKTDRDIAEDNLDAIIRIFEDIGEIMKRVARQGFFDAAELALDHATIEEVIADRLHDVWHKNHDNGVSVSYPEQIPSFVPSFVKWKKKTVPFRPDHFRGKSPINPATMTVKGDVL